MTDFNILLSSAGRRVALIDILRSTLGHLGLSGKVVAADSSPTSSAFHAADEGILVPRSDDPSFIPRMLEICSTLKIRLLFPYIDPELPIYAAHRDLFSEIGTTVVISAPEVIDITWDKHKTHAWLVNEGFPTVRQTTCDGIRTNGSGWHFPVLVKPSNGSSSEGVAIVKDPAHLEVATREGSFVVQSIAAGDEYTVDVLAARNGRCVCAVPRKRIEVRAGEVSKGVTSRFPEVESLAARICEGLPGAYGPLNIQIFADDTTGELNVIEINPRWGGGFPLSWEAGAKYPQWIIEEILDLPSTASPTSWQDGLVMLRWDQAVFTTADRIGLKS